MQEQIERDLKAALLGGDKKTVETLKVIKSALLYEMVSLNARESGLSEEQSQKVLAREAKKRAEAAELYKNANEPGRADAELAEKQIIDRYLPEQLSETDIAAVVKEEISKLDNASTSDMGRIIGAVKSRLGGQAEGSVVARLVKESLEQG